MSAHVVISYRPGDAEQAVIAETLHPMSRISFLPEVPASQHRAVLKDADVLLGMSLSTREIDPGIIPTMEKLGLIQLVFSGADRIDFTRVPENVLIACNPGAFAQPIAEHVLAMTLALAKKLLPNHQRLARGDLIVQEDLFRHLQRHPVFGAGIDTWWVEPGTHGFFRLDYPFFELPNVIGSPHNADDVPGAMTTATQQAADNVRKYLMGRDIRGRAERMDYQC